MIVSPRGEELVNLKNREGLGVCVIDPKEKYYKAAGHLGARKVQFFKPYVDRQSIELAHQNGIICNLFWADDPEEAIQYRDMGIDCILTNDYLTVKNAWERHFSR